MEKRKGTRDPGGRPFRRIFSISYLPVAIILLSLALAGCAAPGDPVARRAPVPAAIADLTATQEGNSVVLTFILPNQTVQHRLLKRTPDVEIYRDFEAPVAGQPSAEAAIPNPTLLVTIPGAMVDSYVDGGRIRYVDMLRPQDFTEHPGEEPVYVVRTRTSAKQASADSNPAATPITPAPVAIQDLKVEVIPHTIELNWTPPERTGIGTRPLIAGYHIYRGECTPESPVSSATKRLESCLTLRGDAGGSASSFRDSNFEWGKTYMYSVRSFVSVGTGALESSDSNLISVSPKDVFAPAAPVGLQVIYVPAQGAAPADLELSWAISPETGVAGYNVYRSEQQDTRGARLNTELLLTPAFRDMNAQPGHHYFYRVTAVDHSQNESLASAAVEGSLPGEQAKP